VLLTAAIPLQSRFENVARLPLEHWDGAVFETLNPRAFLSISDASSLLTTMGKTAASRIFRKWTDRLNRTDVIDEERDRSATLAFARLLDSDFVWMPALAWVVERLHWDALLALVRIEFGETPTQCTNERYKAVEAAILRENLLRVYAPIEDLWLQTFGDTEPPARASRFPPLAYRVLHLARLCVSHQYSPGAPVPEAAYAFSGPAPGDDKVLAQGLLGHIIQWNRPSHLAQRKAQAVLRQHSESLPAWTRHLLSVEA
jgi:hypothetical protein